MVPTNKLSFLVWEMLMIMNLLPHVVAKIKDTYIRVTRVSSPRCVA